MPTTYDGREAIETRNAAEMPNKADPQHSVSNFLATALIVLAILATLVLFFSHAPSNTINNPLPEPRLQPG